MMAGPKADPKFSNDDNWAKAVNLLTGLAPPPRATLFDKLKGNEDIPLMHVRVEELDWRDIPDYQYLLHVFLDQHGWRTFNTDYTIPFLAPKEGQGARLYPYRAYITFLMPGHSGPPTGGLGLDLMVGEERTNDVLKGKGSTNSSGEALKWDSNPLVEYVYGPPLALDKLLDSSSNPFHMGMGYDPDGLYSTYGFNKYGKVEDKDVVDLLSFTEVARTFDRVAKFFDERAADLRQWEQENIGEGSESWDGTSAAIFKELVHKLVRNYEGYAEQVKGKGDQVEITIDKFTVRTEPARVLAQAQRTLLDEAQNLYQLWLAWRPESNPSRWLYDMLVGVAGNLRLNSLDFDIPVDDYLPSGQDEDVASRGNKDGVVVTANPNFKNEIGEIGGWVGERSFGSPLDMATWRAIGNEAIARWDNCVSDFLGAAGADSVGRIQAALSDASKAFGVKVNDRDRRSISEIASKQEAKKDKKDAKAAAAEAKAAADRDRADAKAAAAEAKAAADKDRADAKAAADKEREEAKKDQADARKAAEAQQAAVLAQNEKARAEAKKEQDKEKEEAKKAQEEAKREAQKEKDEAKKEQDKEKEEAKKEYEAEKEEAKKEQEQARQESVKEKQQARLEAERAKAQAQADYDQQKADAAAERQAAEHKADRQEAEARQEYEHQKSEAEQDRQEAKDQAERDRAEAQRAYDRRISGGDDEDQARRDYQHRLADIDARERNALHHADQVQADAKDRYDDASAAAKEERQQARAEAEQARRDARAAYDERMGDIQAGYDQPDGGQKDIEELIRQRIADMQLPGQDIAAGSPYASAFSDDLSGRDDLDPALGRPQGNTSPAGSGYGPAGGSPGMYPPMGRGGGESGGGNSERTRNVFDSAVGRTGRAGVPRAAGDEEHRVVPRTARTSSSTPFRPSAAGRAGAAEGQPQTASADRDRTTWLAEEEDVWGTDEGGAPQALGR